MYNLNELLVLPSNQGELHILKIWSNFSKESKIPLYTCRTVAIRRGILDSVSQLQNVDFFVNCEFHVCGLTEIMEKVLSCDRVIQF